MFVVLASPAALGQSEPTARLPGPEDLRPPCGDRGRKQKEGTLTPRSSREPADRRARGDIGSLSALIAQLEADLTEHRNRLARLEERVEEQTRGIEHLQEQFAIAQARLEERLIELYQSEETDSLGVLLQIQSLGDLVDQLEYFESIGRQDQAITAHIQRLRSELKVARAETRLTKIEVGAETEALAEKTAEQVAARAELVARQNALAAARANQQSVRAGVRTVVTLPRRTGGARRRAPRGRSPRSTAAPAAGRAATGRRRAASSGR